MRKNVFKDEFVRYELEKALEVVQIYRELTDMLGVNGSITGLEKALEKALNSSLKGKITEVIEYR